MFKISRPSNQLIYECSERLYSQQHPLHVKQLDEACDEEVVDVDSGCWISKAWLKGISLSCFFILNAIDLTRSTRLETSETKAACRRARRCAPRPR
jgi:hypothetical protein